MPMLINTQNPLRLPVPFRAFAAMSTTAWMIHSGPAFPEPELVLRKAVLPDQEALKSL